MTDVTPLGVTVLKGDVAGLEATLRNGADPNQRWGERGDHLPLGDALMRGFDWDPRLTPLEYGLRLNDVVRVLLRHGADPNLRFCEFESRQPLPDGRPGCENEGALTPLMAASLHDRPGVVYQLLEAGAKPLDRNWFGGSALEMAQSAFVYDLIAQAAFVGPDADREAAGELAAWHGIQPGELLTAVQRGRISAYYPSGVRPYGLVRTAVAGQRGPVAGRDAAAQRR